MTLKINVTFCFVRCLIIVSTCALMSAATVPGLAYTKSDVKRGEDMVATKNFKGAIELLSALTKDFDFCVANPEDAARAGMLLCSAYEGSGDKSDAYKAAVESTNLALAQIWAPMKKTVPELKGRLEEMAEICQGHPQSFAEFTKTLIPKAMDTDARSAIEYLGVILVEYRKLVSNALIENTHVDLELLLQSGDYYAKFHDYQPAIQLYEEVKCTLSRDQDDMRMRTLVSLVMAYSRASKFEDVIVCGKQYLQLPVRGIDRTEIELFVIDAYERLNRFDEAVAMRQTLVNEDDSGVPRLERVMNLGDTLYKAKRYGSAVQSYDEVRKAPDIAAETKAQASYYIGLCRYELRNLRSACREMNSVISSYPESIWAKKARGQLYFWGELRADASLHDTR